jgi:hypothetical protein
MNALKRAAMIMMVLLMMAPLLSVSAQGPIIKRVDFMVSGPFQVKNSNVILPAGKYILLQVFQQHPDVFYLYQNDLMHEPIATVQTTRIDYSSTRYPGKTKMLVDMNNEDAMTAMPVIDGWNIPGYDGWEITSTVMDKNRAAIARSYKRHSATPVQVIILSWQ